MTDVESLERNARALLGQLRSGTFYFGDIRRQLDSALTRAKLSYADIGTSEKEILGLRPQGEFFEAKRRLELLRRGAGNPVSHHTRLLQALHYCGKSLEDIGSSEEEVLELLPKDGLYAVRQRLERLRQRPDDFMSQLSKLRESLRSGGHTLADLGTSEKELKDLWKGLIRL